MTLVNTLFLQMKAGITALSCFSVISVVSSEQSERVVDKKSGTGRGTLKVEFDIFLLGKSRI
ncbi:MAG TPA: hypothetical protein VLF61_00680 [Rhabdochlamydiaceae bacterium]|nr:hypothetical protein [Rhabdochlamydiaceae bacterium]